MAEILVIGDDLTGTNATAAMYARDGLSAVTVLGAATPVGLEDQIQVIACSTGSRHLPPAEAALRVRDAVTMLGRPDQVLNKRFDTTLRGNVGAEIEAALETVRKMSPDRRVVGLVVPAFLPRDDRLSAAIRCSMAIPSSWGPPPQIHSLPYDTHEWRASSPSSVPSRRRRSVSTA